MSYSTKASLSLHFPYLSIKRRPICGRYRLCCDILNFFSVVRFRFIRSPNYELRTPFEFSFFSCCFLVVTIVCVLASSQMKHFHSISFGIRQERNRHVASNYTGKYVRFDEDECFFECFFRLLSLIAMGFSLSLFLSPSLFSFIHLFLHSFIFAYFAFRISFSKCIIYKWFSVLSKAATTTNIILSK